MPERVFKFWYNNQQKMVFRYYVLGVLRNDVSRLRGFDDFYENPKIG